jgi:predicted amidophosphoribosyltransferase
MRELVKMDNAVKIEHAALRWTDEECYYLFDFYAGKRFGFDPDNDLVKNLKRRIDRSDELALKHKEGAIEDIACLLGPALAALFDFTATTFVPVPPSRTRSSSHYDNRVAQLLRLACPPSADIRELIVCREERAPAHFSEVRPSVEKLFSNYMPGEAVAGPVRERIVVFDDVVTSGNHFMACKRFLLGRFPGREVVGVFVARRVLG